MGTRLQTTLGILEWVAIPSLGIKNILVKVDTGAFSGALHCTGMKVVSHSKDKQKVLKFTPLGDKKLATETTEFWQTHVRSASGHKLDRFLIEATLEINGKKYKTLIGLADRGKMKTEMIIGRRFLRENNILVDVRRNQELDTDGGDIK